MSKDLNKRHVNFCSDAERADEKISMKQSCTFEKGPIKETRIHEKRPVFMKRDPQKEPGCLAGWPTPTELDVQQQARPLQLLFVPTAQDRCRLPH